MKELDDCLRKGHLAKTSANIEKAKASLRIAKENIVDARIHCENKLYNWAFIASYTAMFHASRGLLFKDGMKERSHFCLCVYVREKYRGRIEARYLNELDILREQRHAILYGDRDINTKEVQEAEADDAIKLAEGFLSAVEEIIEGG